MTNFYRFRIFIAVIRTSYFLYKILNNFFFIYEQITRRASAKSNPRVKFPRFYFSFSLLLSGSKISPLRVYFSQHVQLRKLLLRESIAAALSATLFFLDTLCAAFALFSSRRIQRKVSSRSGNMNMHAPQFRCYARGNCKF